MIRIIVLATIAILFVSTASAQQPSPQPPAKPIVYSLSPDQAAALKRALALADFWLQVRIAAAGATADGHGFELQRAELLGLAQALQAQEQAAAAPPPPVVPDNPPIADPPLPQPAPAR